MVYVYKDKIELRTTKKTPCALGRACPQGIFVSSTMLCGPTFYLILPRSVSWKRHHKCSKKQKNLRNGNINRNLSRRIWQGFQMNQQTSSSSKTNRLPWIKRRLQQPMKRNEHSLESSVHQTTEQQSIDNTVCSY